jgi:hypothetical protein
MKPLEVAKIFCLLALWTLPGVVNAQFIYVTNNGSITITGFTGLGVVVIPSSTNGLPVTSIGTEAFYRQYRLTSVTIPDSITNIGDSAFYYCTGVFRLLWTDQSPSGHQPRQHRR